MKTPRSTPVFSFARSVTAVTLIIAAFAMAFIAASSGSARLDDISISGGKIAPLSAKRAPDTPTTSRGHGHGPKLVWLKIMAFTDAPVAGADVSVSVNGSHGRPLVEAKAATNNQGAFAVLVRPEPSFLRVSVSGGTTNGNPFPWHLSADVVLTDPAHQIVIVNPATTLVSRVLDKRPNLKLDGAEALVRSFLQLPTNYSLGLALRQGARYRSRFFSPASLLAEAKAAGGLDGFENQLLQELISSPGATHSFREPKSLGSSDDPEIWIAENLASGALSYVGGQGVGWIMTATGLPTFGATSDSIASLEEALLDLASAIEDLANEVAQLNLEVKATAAQTQYTIITTTAETYATTIQAQESDLQFFAQYCPPLPEGTTPPPTPDQYCVENLPLVISELQEEYTQAYYEQVEELVQDNGTLGLEGMLHLYSYWLGLAKPFWRAADSTAMQNLYNYWDTILTTAANMRMELFHYLGDQNTSGGTAQITAFMGNPNLSPVLVASSSNGQSINALTGGILNVQSSTASFPSSGYLLVVTSNNGSQIVAYTGLGTNSFTGCSSPGSGTVATGGTVTNEGIFQINQTSNQKLMYPALTSTNVFVNTTDHMMWSMNPWNMSQTTVSNCKNCVFNDCGNITTNCTQCTQLCTVQAPSPSCTQLTYPLYIASGYEYGVFPGYEGFTGWAYNPTKTQWQNLVSRAPAASSGTDWHDWLISQTQAVDPESPISPGFFNIKSCGNPAAWTATNSQGTNFDYVTSDWYVIQLHSDSYPLITESGSSYYFNWPIRALASGEQYYYYQ